MRYAAIVVLLAGLVSGLAGYCAPTPALAAAQDGNWSVLVITEKGGCDPGYRYSVIVSNGRVSYQGDAAVTFNGTVAGNGLIKVRIKGGDRDAAGTGQLLANAGTGTWRSNGSSGACSGRWEAERR